MYICLILHLPFTERPQVRAKFESMLTIIVGGAAAGLLIMMLIIVITLACHHKRKSKKLKRELTEKKYEITC